MCIIVEKEPGAMIPSEAIEKGCRINPDGYGLAFVDQKKKRLVIEHSVVKNDPEVIFNRLSALKDKKVFLHLRYATVGAVSRMNAHPFQTLRQPKDSFDLALFHNGTLTDYSPSDKTCQQSDSYFFNERYVRPLALRFSNSGKNLLKDRLFARCLEKEVGGFSVLLLVDSFGNSLWINGDRGKTYDGYKTSNDHFDTTWHYRLGQQNSGYQHQYPNATTWMNTRRSDFPGAVLYTHKSIKAGRFEQFQKILEDEKTSDTLGAAMLEYEQFYKEVEVVRDILNDARRETKETDMLKTVFRKLANERTSFVELVGAKDLSDVGNLTEEQLIAICENYPKAAAQLVIDCLRAAKVFKDAEI